MAEGRGIDTAQNPSSFGREKGYLTNWVALAPVFLLLRHWWPLLNGTGPNVNIVSRRLATFGFEQFVYMLIVRERAGECSGKYDQMRVYPPDW